MEEAEIIYVIRPRDTLRQLQLITENKKFSGFLKSEICLMGSHHRDFWYETDYEMMAKLVYMLGLYRQWGQARDPLLSQLMDTLLGKPPFQSQTFDRWWTLENVDIGHGLPDLMKYAKADEIKLLRKSGNVKIDKWVEDFIEWATAREENAVSHQNPQK